MPNYEITIQADGIPSVVKKGEVWIQLESFFVSGEGMPVWDSELDLLKYSGKIVVADYEVQNLYEEICRRIWTCVGRYVPVHFEAKPLQDTVTFESEEAEAANILAANKRWEVTRTTKETTFINAPSQQEAIQLSHTRPQEAWVTTRTTGAKLDTDYE